MATFWEMGGLYQWGVVTVEWKVLIGDMGFTIIIGVIMAELVGGCITV